MDIKVLSIYYQTYLQTVSMQTTWKTTAVWGRGNDLMNFNAVSYHIHSDLANVSFAILLLEVLDPCLFFGNEVYKNIL